MASQPPPAPASNCVMCKVDELMASQPEMIEKLNEALIEVSHIYMDAPIERREEIIRELDTISSYTKANLAPSLGDVDGDGERVAKTRKTQRSSDDVSDQEDESSNEESSDNEDELIACTWTDGYYSDKFYPLLTRDLDSQRLYQVSLRFQDNLLIELGKFDMLNGKGVMILSDRWTVARVRKLAEHVFRDMLGNMRTRILSMKGETDGELKMSQSSFNTAMLATEAKKGQNIPKVLYNFFHNITRSLGLNATPQSEQNSIARRMQEYKLYESHCAVKNRLWSNDAEVLDYLKGKGVVLSSENTRLQWQSALTSHLIDELHFEDENDLKNMCRMGKGTYRLVEVFGEGSIGFLHHTSLHKFRDWGDGPLKKAWMILDRVCPELRKLAELMNETIIKPINDGKDIVVDGDVGEDQELTVEDILKSLKEVC